MSVAVRLEQREERYTMYNADNETFSSPRAETRTGDNSCYLLLSKLAYSRIIINNFSTKSKTKIVRIEI